MKRILITGSSGFLGKRLLQKMASEENQFVLFCPSSSTLNLMDNESVDAYFRDNSFDIIIHLAAKHGGVGLATAKSLQFLEENLILNYNVVHSSLKYNVKQFIMIGSSCCYSNDVPVPTSEEQLWNGHPENTYGVCKLVLLEHLMAQEKMDWVCLTPPNLYGPDDHFGTKDAHFIPATVEKFESARINNSPYIEVWGDGSQVRDFIYIDDMAQIVYNALYNRNYSRKILNTSTNVGTSVKDIVLMIRSCMGCENIDIHWDTSKPTGTIKKVLLNHALLRIDPSLTLTNFDQGINMTINWYKRNKSR